MHHFELHRRRKLHCLLQRARSACPCLVADGGALALFQVLSKFKYLRDRMPPLQVSVPLVEEFKSMLWRSWSHNVMQNRSSRRLHTLRSSAWSAPAEGASSFSSSATASRLMHSSSAKKSASCSHQSKLASVAA